jgi:hypothetical protein
VSAEERPFAPHPMALAMPCKGGLSLALAAVHQAAGSPWGVPAYRFDLRRALEEEAA